MSYHRVWRIELYENKDFKVILNNGDERTEGHGPTPQEAYWDAEIRLIVKPGFLEVKRK